MRALLCRATGGPENLKLGELARPRPGPGEVLVEVAAAGVNFADILMVAGRYQEKPTPPFAPGMEAAGVVAEVGAGVTRVGPGERVLALLDGGGFADYVCAPEHDVFVLPESMDMASAAAFPVAYGTAHGALTWRAALEPGEILVVHGAAGGAGLATVEVGRILGARIIATARGAEKLAIAEAHGADHTLDSEGADLRGRIKAICREAYDRRGADVVFDPVGGEVFEESLRALDWNGRLLVIGFACGKLPHIRPELLLVKNVSAIGYYWGSYRRHAPELLARQFAELFAWYEAGKLTPLVSERFPLAEGAQALARLATRQSRGKLVLTMD